MQYLDLLKSLPKTRRDVRDRAASRTGEVIQTARRYGREYFDGDRKYGYGGYYYDGRWRSVAFGIAAHYGVDLRILDVGCAKGFLVRDLIACSDPYGIDVSEYAVVAAPHPEAVGRLHLGDARRLPFPDGSFDLVLSINTLHNLERSDVVLALKEMCRVSRGKMFVQVDAYRTPAERALFLDWVLTAKFHGFPDDWAAVFAEAGYDGDYAWTIVEAS